MATSARAMTLRLDEAEYAGLILASEAEHVSMQFVARKAVREYLARHPLDEDALNAHGRALIERYGAVMKRLAQA
jgi:hypothetical protein